ncbi:MAG: hypothetical protein ACHP7D_02365 [Lysobacterales bacterium]
MTTPATSGHHHDFATTRWSLVTRPERPQVPGTRDALAELAVSYWYPIYAYMRHGGYSPQIAQDITRGFLHELIRSARERPQPAPKQCFRDFLLARLQVFLNGDLRAIAADDEGPDGSTREELEARNRLDNAETDSPEQAYQRTFAIEIIARAFRHLRTEAGTNDHIDMYEAMRPFLSREPGPADYDDLARRLDARPLALVVALKRLRERFRELVARELSDTVGAPDDLVKEQKTLHDILRRPS